MIGKRQNFKRLFLFAVVLFSSSLGYSQTSYEAKAVEYFCSKALEIDASLRDVDIVFKGFIEARPSKVYDVEDCLGNINLIKGEIPNKSKLDSLEADFSKKEYKVRELDVSCKIFKKGICRLFKRSVLDMSLYSAIEYSDKVYVEIFLHDKKQMTYRIVVMTFDEQKEVSDHCLKFITYH